MKKCENNGCSNNIDLPSIDCPGQCYTCAVKSRERVRYAIEVIRETRNTSFLTLSKQKD